MLQEFLRKIEEKIWASYRRMVYLLFIAVNQPSEANLQRNIAINQAKLSLISKTFKKCGKELFVDFPITIHNAGEVEVGDNVALGAYVLIWGGGGVKIGNRVMIAAHSVISSQSHDAKAEQPRWTKTDLPIVIEDDVWIGAGSVILPGIRVGKCAIVGAGSVVTKDVPPNCIVAGSPAKPIHEGSRKLGGSDTRS